jgi:beta-glucosidase/6-phospho-beta-glucosidase/beta-galactosidase
MAFTGTIVTVAEMQFYAGENVDATGDVEDNHNQAAGEAEAYLSALVKYDIVTNWSLLDTGLRKLFSEWAARYGANGLIAYNMEGYTTRAEAEDMININWARMEKIEEILKNISVQDFMSV